MAICSLAGGYPVAPRDCTYDAFKVQRTGPGKIQHVLRQEYEDANANGQLDAGEPGLAGWTITISCSNGVTATVTTDASGDFTYTTPAAQPSSGTPGRGNVVVVTGYGRPGATATVVVHN